MTKNTSTEYVSIFEFIHKRCPSSVDSRQPFVFRFCASRLRSFNFPLSNVPYGHSAARNSDGRGSGDVVGNIYGNNNRESQRAKDRCPNRYKVKINHKSSKQVLGGLPRLVKCIRPKLDGCYESIYEGYRGWRSRSQSFSDGKGRNSLDSCVTKMDVHHRHLVMCF
jgi:hypothetical protein